MEAERKEAEKREGAESKKKKKADTSINLFKFVLARPAKAFPTQPHQRTSSESIGKLGNVLSALAMEADGIFSSTHRRSSS